MADMDHDQRMRLDEIRRAHEERMALLQVQAAKSGRSTPPEVISEIRQIQKDLGLANAMGDASSEMLELLGRFAQRRATDALVMDIQLKMEKIEKSVRLLWYTTVGFMVGVVFIALLTGVYIAARMQVL